ncbi:MAG TPA: hypothetical protein VNB24_05355 [Acidimicrobiales bacterium]|nr:hypothetical protein [Acidimicrobiales bacterium]
MRKLVAQFLAAFGATALIAAWVLWVADQVVLAVLVAVIGPLPMTAAVALYPNDVRPSAPTPGARRAGRAVLAAVVLTSMWVAFVRHVAPRHDWSSVGLACRTGGTGSSPREALDAYYRGCLFRPHVRSSRRLVRAPAPFEEAIKFSIEKRRAGDFFPEASLVVGRRDGLDTWEVDRGGEGPVMGPA